MQLSCYLQLHFKGFVNETTVKLHNLFHLFKNRCQNLFWSIHIDMSYSETLISVVNVMGGV